MWVYLNDRFMPQAEAAVSVFDHGFLYGDGVYETLRTYRGSVFMLDHHLVRLERSARAIGLALPPTQQPWRSLLEEAMHRNSLMEAYIRITISRGVGDIGLDPRVCPHPTLVILAKALPAYSAALYEAGVALTVVTTRRNEPRAIPPHVKSLNFLNNILAKQEAIERGAFDGIMLNGTGYLAECTTSNVFFVRDGRLYTPAVTCGILDGITRDLVLSLARKAGIEVMEGMFQPAALHHADECFLTNTTMEIMPVQQVDGIPVGSGKPGPMTHRLAQMFRSFVDTRSS